jgi:WD40 repeat protein
MRWLKCGLVAGWVGVHAWLWMLLPALPFVMNDRVQCVLPFTLPSAYYLSDWSRWPSGDIVSSPYNNFAFADCSPTLVAGDATSIHIYDLATRRVQRTWEIGVTGPNPENGVEVWALSADGRYAVVKNGGDTIWLMNLVSGVLSKLSDGRGVHFRARFTADADHPQSQRLLLMNGWTLSIVDPESEAISQVHLANLGEVLAVSPDGHTAAVGVSSNYSGSHRSSDVRLGLELIDVAVCKTMNLDDFHQSGRWLSCRIAPDGRTVAGSVSIRAPTRPGTQTSVEYPCLMTWDVGTGRRLQTVTHAWDCGWCADSRLVVRNEDGDCYNADAELKRLGELPLSGRLTAMHELSVDHAGKFLVVKQVRPTGELLRRFRNWLKPGSADSFTAAWECFDLAGRKVVAVPGWTGDCDISHDGKYFAVGSPGGRFVDIHSLPTPDPAGVALALMIAEVAVLIAWTARRRRFVRRESMILTP